MKMNRILKSKKSGFAMGLVLLVVVILSVTGAALLTLGLQSRLLAIQNISEIAARSAADAGLTETICVMNRKLEAGVWDDSALPQATNKVLPNCNATFSYSVTKSADGDYVVESIGKSGRVEKKVNPTLRLQGLFEYALFMRGDITLKNGTTIDWYNYDADDETLQIGTNSTLPASIVAKTGVTIDGDVVVGVDGDTSVVIDSQSEAVITGETYAAPEEYQLPAITVPESLQLLPSQGILQNATTISSSVKYDGINLGNSEIITIDEPVSVYVTGDVILSNSAQLQIVGANINPDASLTLYLGGNLTSKNGGIINNMTEESKKLKIYGLESCRFIDFMTAGSFYGAIYAPNADVRLHNSVEVFGAIIANNFIQDVNADFHYDASLRDVSVNDEGVRFVIKRWCEE